MDQISYRDIVKKLAILFSIHSYYIHNASSSCGLYKGQLPILEQASMNENCTQKEIAETLCVSPPSIATSIKRMEKAGLLEKTADENDLRNNHIKLTDKGRELTNNCREVFNGIDEKMFNGFTSEECEQMVLFFERMINNLVTEEITPQKVREFIRRSKPPCRHGCKQGEKEDD